MAGWKKKGSSRLQRNGILRNISKIISGVSMRNKLIICLFLVMSVSVYAGGVSEGYFDYDIPEYSNY